MTRYEPVRVGLMLITWEVITSPIIARLIMVSFFLQLRLTRFS